MVAVVRSSFSSEQPSIPQQAPPIIPNTELQQETVIQQTNEQSTDDARNVNQWHWEERNMIDWARHRVGELMSSTVVYDGSDGNVTLMKMEKFEGDCYLNNRKGRKFFIFDLTVCARWKCIFTESSGRTHRVCECGYYCGIDGNRERVK